MNSFRVVPVQPADKEEWLDLFRGYADFYNVAMTDRVADTVWDWLLNPHHVLDGLIARDATGAAVGMAHVRACPRPLAGSEVGFLDDMFVVSEARGTGAADALFAALREHAERRGWTVIRWITQHFNERGRAFYDRYTGGPTDFIMYQWTPDDAVRRAWRCSR